MEQYSDPFIITAAFAKLSPACPCLLCLGAENWTSTRACCHQSWVKGQDCFCLPASSTAPHAPQGALGGISYHRGRLLAHGQLGVCWDPPSAFCEAASQLGSLQNVLVPGPVHSYRTMHFWLDFMRFVSAYCSGILCEECIDFFRKGDKIIKKKF